MNSHTVTIEKESKTIVDKNTIVRKTFPITGMSCAGCASSVESILNTTPGVEAANVNFASSSVLVTYNKQLSETALQNALREIGFDLIVDVEDLTEAQQELQREHYRDINRRTRTGYVLHGLGARTMGFVGTYYPNSLLVRAGLFHECC